MKMKLGRLHFSRRLFVFCGLVLIVGGIYLALFPHQKPKPAPAHSNQSQTQSAQKNPVTKPYLTIKEWGIKVPVGVPDDSRFSYSLGNKGESDEQAVGLYDNQIKSADNKNTCIALLLVRSKDGLFLNDASGKREPPKDEVKGTRTRVIEGYTYRIAPTVNCGYDQSKSKEIEATYAQGFGVVKADLSNVEIAR